MEKIFLKFCKRLLVPLLDIKAKVDEIPGTLNQHWSDKDRAMVQFISNKN